MGEGKMTTLQGSMPDATSHSGGGTEARFETEASCLVLHTATDSPDGAAWTVRYAGEPGGAPAREVVAGYTDRNISDFWGLCGREAADPAAAYTKLCWVRGVDELETVSDAKVELAQDFHFNALVHMLQEGFAPDQAKHSILLLQDVYDSSVAGGNTNSSRGTFDPDMSYAMFKDGLMALAAPPTPHKPLLELGKASSLGKYMNSTFYAHYELYVYAHIYEQAANEEKGQGEIETPMQPLAMTAGISQEEHDEKARLAKEKADAEAASAARDAEAAEIAKALENMDPETEAVVNAVVRRQERAMRKQFEEYYDKAGAKMTELEAQ